MIRVQNKPMLRMTSLRILVVLACHGCCIGTGPGLKTPLHIGGLCPLSEKDGWSRFYGYSAKVGMDRAVRDINNRSDVLANYTIVMHLADTEGDLPMGLNRLYELIYTPPVKVAIVGSVLSLVTETFAWVAGRWSIVQMSPGASTPVLSDRSKYPHAYRILTSSTGRCSAYVKFCRLFGWNKIATIYELEEPYIGMTSELQRLAKINNQTLFGIESFYTDPQGALERLKEKDARIIFGSFYSAFAAQVFCAAYKLGMYGPNYVWIVPGFSPETWWSSSEGVSCSSEELKTAAEGHLTVSYIKYGMGTEPGINGMTPQQFREEMSDIAGYNITVRSRGLYANGYDAVWALALALDQAEAVLNRSLDSYQYGDEEFARVLGDCIMDLAFLGMSGPIRFSKDGDRIGMLFIEQNIGGRRDLVGTYNKITDVIDWFKPLEELWYYTGGTPPFDSDNTKTLEILQGTPVALVVSIGVVAAMGTALAVMFVVFNIWKRKNRQIKMSSPKVNNIIASGIMLAYLGVVLLGIDRSMVEERTLLTVCKFRSWIIPLAFTLAFGGMFTKMWRVYSIVIANKTKRKVIKDHYLFGMIAVLLLVDLAILIPWQIIDPIFIQETRTPIVQTEEDFGRHEKRQLLYVTCTTNNNIQWTLAVITYKGLIVVIGAFLAWSTRNIKVSGLNDSYHVGLSIYNTVICCVVAVPLSILNVSSAVVTFALVSGFLLLCITASLCMLFIPKVIAVYWKKEVAADFTGTRIGTTMGAPMTEGVIGRDIPTTSAVVSAKVGNA